VPDTRSSLHHQLDEVQRDMIGRAGRVTETTSWGTAVRRLHGNDIPVRVRSLLTAMADQAGCPNRLTSDAHADGAPAGVACLAARTEDRDPS
jgi:hypothetical protein